MTRKLTTKEKAIQSITPVLLSLMKVYWFLFRPHKEGVKVLLFNSGRNRVLLVRHTYGDHRWMFPGGGKEGDEDPEETAQREMREELDISLQNIDCIDQITSRKEWKHDHISIVIAETADLPEPNPFEIAEVQWFKQDDLPQLGSVSKQIFSRYVESRDHKT